MWALRAKLGWDKVISADTSAKPWASGSIGAYDFVPAELGSQRPHKLKKVVEIVLDVKLQSRTTSAV
jgi:hypothetical protein